MISGPVRGRLLAAAILMGIGGVAAAQEAPVNGIRPADLRAHAIVDATVVVEPGVILEGATVVIRNGVIEAVGIGVTPPADARIWSGADRTIYPGLIDAAVLVKPAEEPASSGDHWNSRVRPQRALSEQSQPTSAKRKELRSLGFTAAAVYPESGIFRGTGVVVALPDEDQHVVAYRDRAPMAMGFDHGGRFGSASYPGSLMGAMAQIRQTIRDAQWHAECRAVYERSPEGLEPPIRADALVALHPVITGEQQVCFEVDDEHDAIRAVGLAREFDLDVMLLGSGLEFRRLNEVARAGVPIIVPLNFPKRPALDTLASTDRVTLRDMMSWEQAPTNPRRLIDAGGTVALTTHRLKKAGEFSGNLHRAIQHGLSEEDALKCLTTTPARLLGVDQVMGTLETGKVANLVVVEGSLFDKKVKIRDVWINGRRHEISKTPDIQMVASMLLTTDLGTEHEGRIDTVNKSLSVTHGDDKTAKAKKVVVQQDQVSFILGGAPFDVDGYVRFSGVINDERLTGTGVLPTGGRFAFAMTERQEPDGAEAKSLAKAEAQDEEPDGDTDADEEGDDDDGCSGVWILAVVMDDMDEEIPATIRLQVDADGSVTGSGSAPEMVVQLGPGSFDRQTGELELEIDHGPELPASQMQAVVDGDSISGEITGAIGQGRFSGTREAGSWSAKADKGDQDEAAFDMPPETMAFPIGAYGFTEPPSPQDVLITNATIWTCGENGIIENGSVLVRDGTIAMVGTSPPAVGDDVLVIDAAGKHVTPGLIDCHSHTGIDGGVNEWAQANTAEVTIADVVNADDINWYRQLAGGLTAANQLHGSANPIGGQNSVVKLKWGGPARHFPVSDAIGGIKFALGENVKRSESRYPNTRMGVETYIRDAFTAASEYQDEMDRYLALPSEQRRGTMPPRPNLELETLVEVLEGERLVHCHSYRQDEILMLIRVADAFGFTIGTFQHILEGYKVADAIARHGAGGSSFSDWWAYKMEVMDAIPYNGALMTDVGVVVSFNSDSSELARRMNTEAAKAVRYGGMDPHEALKLVSSNPARQLQIDHRTGSLEVGKDADFVIWSEAPLSTYARCEQTWIEGAQYFDIDRDQQLRDRDANERQRLIQKILAQAHPSSSKGKGKGKGKEQEEEDAATPDARPTGGGRLMARLLEERTRWMEEQVQLGHDPDEIRPGRCACNDTWWLWMKGGM